MGPSLSPCGEHKMENLQNAFRICYKLYINVFFFIAEGPLCEWRSIAPRSPDDFDTFHEYRDETLQENCLSGSPGVLQWTPDANTPDTVYYQVLQQWKLNCELNTFKYCCLKALMPITFSSQGLDFVPSRENHTRFSPDSFARINWFSFYDKIHNTAESNCYAN